MKKAEKEVLKKVLSKWGKINEQMFNDWKKKGRAADCPWWYNERASLSTFAGAVWGCGGFVLEEYLNQKIPIDGIPQNNGRTDIYFQIGKHHFTAESKLWFPRRASFNSIQSRLEKASEQNKEYRSDATRLSILFVSPAFDADERFESQKGKFIDLFNRYPASVKDYVFPIGAEGLKWNHKRESLKSFPGTAIFIDEVQK